jgi:hypothetical protein
MYSPPRSYSADRDAVTASLEGASAALATTADASRTLILHLAPMGCDIAK